MHFSKTLFALLSIVPLLAQADPESALQFKAVDLNRKRQTGGGSYVSSYSQCLQVCDGYFPQASASKASTAAAVTSAASTKSVAPATTSPSTKVSTMTSASTVTQTSTRTSTRSVTASASAATVTSNVISSKPVSSIKPTTAVPVSTTQSKPTQASSAQATASSASGASPGGVTEAQKQEILTLHNNERAAYGASPLAWNTDLESYAKTYASKCDWKHSGGPYGENLAVALGYPMPSNGVNSWNEERSQYTPGSYSHWTQVVWKGTSEVGCAMVTCANGLTGSTMPAGSQYLVCEYKKPGNVIGQFDANIGAKVA